MRYPAIMVLFSSFRCNSRCVMCSAWRKQKDNLELKAAQIERIFSDKVLSKSLEIINITGGEPTLREDLVDIIKILASRCRNLKRIDIPTNGIDTIQVIDTFEKILAFLLQTNINLAVTVSVDGVSGVHDRVRRVDGAFDAIDKTIDELKELMELYPGLSVGLNTTISRLNYDNLEAVLGYAQQKSLGINFTLAAISEIGVESIDSQELFSLDDTQKRRLAGFVDNLTVKGRIDKRYSKFLLQWLHTGMRAGRCAFREGSSVLCEPDGSLYRCGNFKDFKIGNLLETPFARLNYGNGRHFDRAYTMRCKTCNSNCYLG